MSNTFKIIKILDRYTVAVNIGQKDAAVDDKLYVIDKEGSELKDPDTGEVLGYIDAIKATLRVEEVHEKYSLCVNYRSPTGLGLSGALAGLAQSFNHATTNLFRDDVPLPLNVEDEDIEVTSLEPIKIGDEVKKA